MSRTLLYGLIPPLIALGLALGCEPAPQSPTNSPAAEPDASATADGPSPPLVTAARFQVGKTTVYDPAYTALEYPGGDVPIERGVCTDVVVRALRRAFKFDLQSALHEDMKDAFAKYPRIWGLRGPDKNIDHRRVPNLQRYFERQGWDVPVTKDKADYLSGDLVTCTVPPNRPHIMVISDKTTRTGVPLVIHNIGNGAREEDRLFDFPITGHYRLPKELQVSPDASLEEPAPDA